MGVAAKSNRSQSPNPAHARLHAGPGCFYRNDDTFEREKRAAAYPAAMENDRRYPQDHEAVVNRTASFIVSRQPVRRYMTLIR